MATRHMFLTAAVAAGSWSSLLLAQDVMKNSADMLYFQSAVAAPTNTMTYSFVSREIDMESGLVKGAPYSADAVNEVVQTLGDGNRIVNKSTSARYRDKDGRTRQELRLPTIVGYHAAENSPQIVTIRDPIAGLGYSLDVKNKTAMKLMDRKPDDATLAELRAKLAAEAGAIPAGRLAPGMDALPELRAKVVAEAKTLDSGNVDIHPAAVARSSGQAVTEVFGTAPPIMTEQLGQQTIEGVLANGTRTTSKIPAGQIGNERDIDVVSERWYSPELKMVIMTKHSDPRTGESTFRLTNIRRTDPDPSLFQVPADYTMKDRTQPMSIQVRTGGPKE